MARAGGIGADRPRLRAAGQSSTGIAECLNAEGSRRPKGAVRFHKDIVSRLARRYTPGDRPPRESDRATLGQDEWFVVDLAGNLGVGKNMLHAWLQRGWVRYRRLPGYRGADACAGPTPENSNGSGSWPGRHGLVGPTVTAEVDHTKASPLKTVRRRGVTR
jgi:hypothetical protein